MALKITWRDGWAQISGTYSGRRIRQSAGTRNEAVAAATLRQIESRLDAEAILGPQSITLFEEAALAYMEDDGEERFVAPLLHHFKGRVISTITPKEIRDAAKALYPNAGPRTWNRQAITPARAIINHAADQKKCEAIRVRQFPEPPVRRTHVTAQWVAAFRAEAFARGLDHLAVLVRVNFETGARIGKLCSAMPRDLHWPTGRLDLGVGKNGDENAVTISPSALDELRVLRPRGGRLFGYAGRSSLYGPWRNVCTGASIEYVPPHQAGRHSFATTLHNDHAWDSMEIADAGGWRSKRLVEDVYVHTGVSSRAASTMLGDQVDSVDVRPADGKVVPLRKR